ncbi:MAG: 30S ribosomal protein S20 [Patescibacteria group bacterium]
MPITRQANKKLRHDKKRTKQTMAIRTHVRNLVKDLRKSPAKKALNAVFQALDKATKTHIIHKNKAARLKSRLSKLLKK